jgi:hypothetical protein
VRALGIGRQGEVESSNRGTRPPRIKTATSLSERGGW